MDSYLLKRRGSRKTSGKKEKEKEKEKEKLK